MRKIPPSQPWEIPNLSAWKRLNNYRGPIAKDFRSGLSSHDFGSVVAEAHDGVGAKLLGMFNHQIVGLLTSLLAHLRVKHLCAPR
jgi:hypothetical protein